MMSTEHNHDEHGHTHNVNIKKLDRVSPTKVKLSIEFDADTIKKHEHSTANRYLKMAKLPGFRPGKAPLTMIKEKYKAEISKDVIEHLLQAGLTEACEQKKLMPISRPKINVTEIGDGKPFAFEAEFEVEPEIELKNYKGMPFKKKVVKIEDKEIDDTLNGLRERMASLEPSDATKADKGSFAVVEVGYELVSDATKKQDPSSFTVELGADRLLPKIEKALLEMSVGEEKQVTETFPKDYSEKDLQGQDANFKLKLVELKKKVLPEVDDNFATQVKEGATVATLKQEIKDSLKRSKEEEAKRDERQEMVDYLIDNNKFEVPTVLVDEQAESLLKWMEQDLKRQGVSLSQMKPEEMKSVRERAERMVRSSLLLKEVAVKEKIQIDENLFQDRVSQLAKGLNKTVEETEKYLTGKGMMQRIKDEILTDQIFDFLEANAK